MQPIIKQNLSIIRTPDFRNLGTVLRILLLVNGATLFAALVRESRIAGIGTEFSELVGVVEPHLLSELLLLYAISPWLQQLRYESASAAILVITAALALAWERIYQLLANLPAGSGLRHLLLAVATTLALLGYFFLRAKALSPAIAEARLQALQARIRPHFLFNSINAVLSLVRSEPKRAEVALEDLADLFRVIMRDNRNLAPLADEVLLCRQYLALEKLRLGDRLEVHWHTENMPRDALVPPLILQPLLENAVYHGIEPSSAPGVIAINIFLRRGEVHAVLRNPYQMTGAHHGGNKMALSNVRERLALHFDAEARLESKVARDTYEVHIQLPYRVASIEAGAFEHG